MVNNMSKANIEEVAKILFLQGYAQKEIATKLEVSAVSVSKWKTKGNWEALKTNLLNSKNERLGELYTELAEFNKMIKEKKDYKVANSKEADARRKLIKDIAELERKYNVAQTISIGRDFITFLKDIDFEMSQKVLSYFDNFINHQIEKQKWQQQ